MPPSAHLKQYSFKPGTSGNPGGRTRAAAEMSRLIAKATNGGEELVAFALAVMRGGLFQETAEDGKPRFRDVPNDAKSRTYAHNWLTERLAGKAPQDLDITMGPELTPEQHAMLDALQMSPHQRRERIAELRARLLPANGHAAAAKRGDDVD